MSSEPLAVIHHGNRRKIFEMDDNSFGSWIATKDRPGKRCGKRTLKLIRVDKILGKLVNDVSDAKIRFATGTGLEPDRLRDSFRANDFKARS